MKALRKIIFAASIVIFIGSCGILIKLLLIDPYFSDRSNNKINQMYYVGDESEGRKLGDFDRLMSVNPDIRGWLKVPNTLIDYPVVSPDSIRSDFYLTHNFEKSPSRYGCIFIDSSCVSGTESKNVILHGHHMRDGRMFANLLKFGDLDFYKSTPVVYFDSLSKPSDWKIISIFKTNTRPEQGEIFNYITSSFGSDEKFMEYVYNVRIRSLADIPVTVNETDVLMTLSTCSYEFDDFRTVIVARKVRKGESSDVDVSIASKAENPLMPQCWYDKYGGTRPEYPGFNRALKSGKISWYDPVE